MAAVIRELSGDPPSMLHGMIATQPSHYQTASRPLETQRQSSGSISRHYREDASAIPRNQKQWDPAVAAPQLQAPDSSASRPARLPSPPSSDGHDTPHSTSPNAHAAIEEPARSVSKNAAPSTTSSVSPSVAASALQSPTPQSSQTPLPDIAAALPDAVATADISADAADRPAPRVIKIRDLAHIQSLAQAECVRNTGTGILDEHSTASVRYEISDMPIADVIEMVAGLLNKITMANDLTHDAKQRNVAHQQQAMAGPEVAGPISTSVLAFHGKNVPAISIHSYLSRIHKYCPTTFEVFLSLLVYFDRMTQRINQLVAESATSADSEMVVDSDARPPSQGYAANPGLSAASYFVVDNFNIHRLTIAGVTCASKFFSDVFYTNSRYAKVGGLPLFELNHLEIQFLVLNDFRLHIDVETLESYATMLVEFYARECVASRNGPVGVE